MKNLFKIIFMLLISSMCLAESSMKIVDGDVKFTAVGKPGFLKIKGESNHQAPVGNVILDGEKAKGSFEFLIKNLSTGIDLRDEHMKEKYLEISKFPSSKLVLDPVKLEDSTLKRDFKNVFSGQLTLHGITKPVNGTFSFSAKDVSAIVNFTIKVSDFNIDIPKYMGITVSETVAIEVFFKLK